MYESNKLSDPGGWEMNREGSESNSRSWDGVRTKMHFGILDFLIHFSLIELEQFSQFQT